jgi:hypothetical protein
VHDQSKPAGFEAGRGWGGQPANHFRLCTGPSIHPSIHPSCVEVKAGEWVLMETVSCLDGPAREKALSLRRCHLSQQIWRREILCCSGMGEASLWPNPATLSCEGTHAKLVALWDTRGAPSSPKGVSRDRRQESG